MPAYPPLQDMDPTPAQPGVTAQMNNEILQRKIWLVEQSLGTSGTVDIDFQNEAMQMIDLTGNITFTFSGLEIGRSVLLKIKADGSTRTFTFPSGPAPIFVGAAAPANIAANKTGLLQLRCFGPTVDSVVCHWLVQP
jgi:hypothetical protein